MTSLYRIAKNSLTGATSPFWLSDFGKLKITFPTLIQYFGKDLFKIQPSLYYTHSNIEYHSLFTKDLNLKGLLTKEFTLKIQHLYNNLYDVLSQNYADGEKIKVTFHIEKSLGLGYSTKIYESLTVEMRRKFDVLMGKGQNSLTLIIRKDGDRVINDGDFRKFIASITFYLVMFNAFAAIKDDGSSGYKLFASQKMIYNSDFVTGLYSKDNTQYRLTLEGLQIYNNWGNIWNQEEGEKVWDYEDCWPIYLLEDALDFVDHFRDGIRPLEK